MHKIYNKNLCIILNSNKMHKNRLHFTLENVQFAKGKRFAEKNVL